VYSLDASGLLDGIKRFYPPDTFPGIWIKMDGLAQGGRLKACEMVRAEIEKRDDAASEWLKAHPDVVLPLDEERQMIVRDLLRRFPRLVDTRRGRSGADPFVIAVGVRFQCPVITGEGRTGNMESPRIPDVCDALGLETITFLELIQRERWVFG
jgi:hypothetical protein